MIKNTRYKIVLLAGIFLLPGALAQDINVDFVATIKGTTCNITLEGTRVTADGNDQYTLRILNVALDKIINKMPEAQADFKLVANCDGNIGKITTSLAGNPSVELPYLISPLTSDNSSTTEYIAMGIKLRNASDTEFIPPDGSKKISWGEGLTKPELEMTVALRETRPGSGRAGNFKALATFNFTYE